jgi:hypothetical protein
VTVSGGGDADQWEFSPTHLLGSRLQRRCRVPCVNLPHQAKCPGATAGLFFELELLGVMAVSDARGVLRLSMMHPAQRLQAFNDVVRISGNETGNTLEAGPDSRQPTGTSDNVDLRTANHLFATQLRHDPDAWQARVPRSVSPAVAAPCPFRRPCRPCMPSSSRSSNIRAQTVIVRSIRV